MPNSLFQSTLPARGATKWKYVYTYSEKISIHAPRTGSDEHLRRYIILCDISIHAPRTGSDDAIIDYQSAGFTDFNPRSPHGERHSLLTGLQSENEISIHAPRTGSDNQTFLLVNVTCRFQSTLPARGATCRDCRGKRRGGYFNPRSPHGERHWKKSARNRQNHFNPRSPHGERPGWCALAILPRYFNPRSPHGERRIVALAISFHFIHFNPRSPHGERQGFKFRGIDDVIFQSTLPARGATGLQVPWHRRCNISIHAPRTGSDKVAVLGERADTRNFNPRSPHGERHFRHALQADQRYFNPRSPHGERLIFLHLRTVNNYFNPRSPHGERPDRANSRARPGENFNPRSPHGERHERGGGMAKRPPFQSTLPARGATVRFAIC